MNPVIATVLGVVGAIISIVSITFVVVTFVINRKRDNKADITEQNKEMNGIARSLLELDLKLTQVCNTTSETRTDIKTMNNQLNEHGKQIAIMQNDLKTAFMRIDELRKSKADK